MIADRSLDPATLSAIERRAEIAALLAAGFVRLDEVRLASQIAAALHAPPPGVSFRPLVSLEVPRDASVHVVCRRLETRRKRERSS